MFGKQKRVLEAMWDEVGDLQGDVRSLRKDLDNQILLNKVLWELYGMERISEECDCSPTDKGATKKKSK
jgi:hypothetical protein